MPTYLVERYWPGGMSERLLEALEQGRYVLKQMRGEGRPSVTSAAPSSLPRRVVFALYEGPSAALEQLNERASIPFSRIVEAIAVSGGQAALRRRSSHQKE